MAASTKYVILGYRLGQCAGYIKSVSYSKGKFTFTNDKSKAKTYTINYAQGEIDTLAGMCLGEYSFIYQLK